MRYTTRNALHEPDPLEIDFPAAMEANSIILDAAISKRYETATRVPTVTDDSSVGYSAGSWWQYTTGPVLYRCMNATVGAAVWKQIWPALDADLTPYIKANGSRGLSAAWDAGSWQIRAETFQSDVTTGTAPLTVASTTVCANLHAANSDGLEGHAASYFAVSTESGIWRTMPGSPTRVGDAQFTITDTSNANLYDKAFTKGTILKWEKSGGGFQTAIVKDAAYGSNTVTINILGNTLAAAFTLMKYCIMKPVKEEFIVPGKLPAAALADIGKTIFAFRDILIFSALIRYKTAATTTKGVWDINDDGTTIFTTKPEIAATATKGTETVCDCVLATAVTVVAADSAITLDYDSGHATTPGSDAYVELLYMPAAWRYLA